MPTPRTVLLASTLVLGATLGLTACATSTPSPVEATPVGRYVVRSQTTRLDAVVGFRYAATHPGESWLILQFAATSPTGEKISIPRAGLAVVTPTGDEAPLASQQEFTASYDTLHSRVRQAQIIRDPMGYFPPDREPCRLELFSAPGEKLTFDDLNLDYHRACAGLLYFHLPTPVEAGRYTLVIRPRNGGEIRIPFTL